VDTTLNVERVMDVLRQIDIDDSVVRSLTLENVAAIEVANTLMEIIGVQGGESARQGVSVVPVDASNTIILRGNVDEVARLLPIVKDLDQKGSGRVAIDTIYLNHADAEELVPILQQLIDSSAGGEGGTAMGGITPSVAFHKPTNALIVNAPPDMQRHIRSIVGTLDIRRPQVLIEAVVVEISNTTARELGVQYLTGGGNLPVSGANFANTQPNLVSTAGAAYFLGPGSEPRTRTITTTNADGTVQVTEEQVFDNNDPSNAVAGQLVEAAVGELLGLNGFLFGAADQQDDGSVYGVLVSALQTDGDSNVLSVPSVTLLDNETALLQVGQEIPIVTGEATGADFQGGFRTIERKDVGNILEVTPQINEGNTVQLKIRLEVSSIGAFTALTEDIITNKSTVETVALAEDGQTLVIGGLIDNDRRETETKVPLLGDIPVVGNLFKGQSRSEEDMTLMVFIRPTILRNSFTADNVTARKYEYVTQQQQSRSKSGDQRLNNVMQNYIGPGNYFTPNATGTLSPVAPTPLSREQIDGREQPLNEEAPEAPLE
ncbi:MAG: secretin N-terminal domain-containing protein, partial [Pseudomonadota bacterium]